MRSGVFDLVASQFPSRSDGNPYVNLLKSALAASGVESHEHSMYLGGSKRLAATVDEDWLFRHRGRVHMLHFHWLQRFYRSSSLGGAGRRVARFSEFLSLAKNLDYRIAYTFHNLLPHEGMGREMDYRVRRIILEHADVVTCFSQRQRIRLQETFGPRPITVIPHPGYVGAYPDDLPARECRRRLGLPAAARVFTFIGLVRPYKGLSRLCRAFALLDEPGAHLVVAGTSLDPQEDQNVEAMLREDGRIHPHIHWLAADAMQVYVKACDVVVLPYSECWTSGTMMLAFSFGKPVISADPMMLDDPTGLGFFYHTQDDLGHLLGEVSGAARSELREMGRRCLDYARGHPWRDAGSRLTAAYRAALAESPCPGASVESQGHS